MKELLLNSRNFLKIWLANLISTFGDSFFDVVIVVYIMEKTNNSALLAGGVAISNLLGRLFGGLFATRTVDFFHTKHTMILSDIIRAVLLMALIAFSFSNEVALVFYYLMCFGLSFFTAVFLPARSKAITEIIQNDTLIVANNSDILSQSLVQILSWAIGGITFSILGILPSLSIDLITFALSLLLVSGAKWESSIRKKEKKLRKKGLKPHVSLPRSFAIFISLELVYLFLSGFYWAALPLKVIPIGGSFAYGLQGAYFGVGSLFITLVFARFRTLAIKRIYLIGLFANLFGNLLAALAFNTLGIVLGVLVAGLGSPFWSNGERLFIQNSFEVAQQGWAWGLYNTFSSVVMVPSWILGGFLADQFSALSVMAIVCLLQVIIVIVGLKIKGFTIHERSSETDKIF